MTDGGTDRCTGGIERSTHVDRDGLRVPPELREFTAQVVFRTPRATIQHFGDSPLEPYYGLIDESHFGDVDEFNNPKNPELAPNRVSIKRQGEEPVVLDVEVDVEIVTDGGVSDDDMKRTARWHGIAEANIEEWGLQDEETLLLAMQEELGELAQAHLEAKHEDGHELRIDEELDDLGALLIQLVKSRNARSLHTETERSEEADH